MAVPPLSGGVLVPGCRDDNWRIAIATGFVSEKLHLEAGWRSKRALSG
jgi:hypothetical protein